MSQVWIAAPGGQPEGPYDEQALRDRNARGELGANLLYWREGMAEWRPLAELVGVLAPAWQAPVTPPPSPYAPSLPVYGAPPPRPRIAFAHDPTNLTRWLVGFLWATTAVSALSLLDDVLQLQLLGRPFTQEEANASDLRSGAIGLLMLLLFVPTGVTFLRWIHRAGVNVRAFGAQGLTISPGWAVGYYFIPFLNLWKPYQAMKEIAQASVDPRRWATALAPSVLGWWWAFWLIDNWVSWAAFQASLRADDVTGLQMAATVSAVSNVTGILSALTAIAMVKAVTAAQRATVERGG